MLSMDFLRSGAKASSLYIVFGDDAYLRRETIQKILREALGDEDEDLAVSRYPGESSDLAEVLDEVRTLPFLAKVRVALVENADPFVTAHRKGLETYAEKPSSSGVLILSVKSWPSNTKLAKLIEKNGIAIDCKSPGERELPAWIAGLAASRFEVKLGTDAARLMVELVGPEVGLLVSEVEKLATYVGDLKKISTDDVAKMVDAGRVQQIWSALDSATTGDADAALVAMDSLLAANEPPQRSIAAIASSLQKVYHAGQLRRMKVEAREACREAGIWPAAVDKTIKQHAHLGPRRVSRLPEMLLKADLDLKGSSQLAPRIVLERLLVELSSPRRD